jgi:ribosome maturation factor RimP
MLGRKEIWEKLEFYVDSPDICLFDIDLPSGSKGTLRVFIAKKNQHNSAITVDDCAMVSRKISNAPEFDELLHKFNLEVSSPGVNRRLRLPEHFAGAIGERVKLSGKTEDGENLSTVGIIRGFDGKILTIEVSVNNNELQKNLEVSPSMKNEFFNINNISKAQIDFLFGTAE